MGQAYARADAGGTSVVKFEDSQTVTADTARWMALGQAYVREGLGTLAVASSSQQ